MSSGNWLHVDELDNAIDYLEAAARFLEEAGEDPLRWKWVAIALHGALYGFAICAIKGTNPPARVLREDGKLIGTWDALRRCQDPTYMEQYTESQMLSVSADEEDAIRLLTEELRNELRHARRANGGVDRRTFRRRPKRSHDGGRGGVEHDDCGCPEGFHEHSGECQCQRDPWRAEG